ncbi:hypothetical protein ACSBR2_039207 [Camellia fascicularis]
MGVLELWVIFTFALVFSLRVQVLNSQNITCNLNNLQALEAFLIRLDSGTINGITCNSSSSLSFFNDPIDSGRVVKLELSGKILAGKLNETTFSGLDQLTTLNLSVTFLRGSLPPSLFQMSNLQVIDLSKNGLSGSIPMSINLPFLEIFDISDNSFESSVPMGICINSTRIRIIDFAVNHFFGRIPSGFGNCSSLEHLWLGQNFLAGDIPEDIFRLPRLNQLGLRDNRFLGELSSGIGNLSDLVVLDISLNSFSGPIPDLQEFYAESNNFSSGIPNSLVNSRTITSLVLRNNSLNSVIDLNCSEMTHLVSLSLAANQFIEPVPDNLPLCSRLKTIGLSRNNFIGQIQESFRKFHVLSLLSLSNSTIFNLSASLDILQQCQNLTTLVLTLNFHDEQLPSYPSLEFKILKALIIAYCRLSEIPKNLTKLECLISKDVLPEDPSLRLPFSFSFSRGVGMLSQYKQIWSLPSTLDLSNNSLTGPIWPQFGNLKNLHYLDLKCNNLSRNIPEDLCGMTSIGTLDLSHNDLSRAIPLSLVNLNFLSKFNVAYNLLYGTIPTGGQFETFPNSSFEGNLGLCSGEHSSPCPISNQVPQVVSPSKLMWGEIIVKMSFGMGFGTTIAVMFLFVLNKLTFYKN